MVLIGVYLEIGDFSIFEEILKKYSRFVTLQHFPFSISCHCHGKTDILYFLWFLSYIQKTKFLFLMFSAAATI